MADVYLAEDERLGRQVAVKVLKARLAADDEFVERFRIEAQAAASLNHPSIVAVYDRGTAEGTTYIAMEYVRGETLKQRLRRDGALPPDEAVTIALAVLSALERRARAGDRPPRRHLVQRHARPGRARGGHRLRHRAHGRLGADAHRRDDGDVLVSLPRAGAGAPGGRALGPLQPRRGALRDAHRARAVPRRDATWPWPCSTSPRPRRTRARWRRASREALAGVAMRALSKDPDDRYQTAEEFAAALRKARRPGRAPDDGVSAAGAPATAGAARAAGAAGAGVLAATAGVAAAGQPHDDAGRRPARGAPVRPPRPLLRPAGCPAAARRAAAPVPATVVAAEAPTRYRSGGEPATSVRPRAPPQSAPRGARPRPARARGRRRPGRRTSTCSRPGATVPAVVGERRSDATRALRDEGLKPVLHYVWADKYASGEVARQSPRGGAKVDDGVKVDLWVSRGPLHIPSPDLSGLAAGVARGRLQAESLNSKSRRAASETAPKGQIFRQQPAAGATVQRGDTVTFWVSSGPPKVYVPDVVGLSQGDASGDARGRRLRGQHRLRRRVGRDARHRGRAGPVAEREGQGRRRGRDPGRRVLTRRAQVSPSGPAACAARRPGAPRRPAAGRRGRRARRVWPAARGRPSRRGRWRAGGR